MSTVLGAPPDPATSSPAAMSRACRPPLSRILSWTGEVLVTIGVLVGLLVVWELWWTDIDARQQQDAIVAAIDWGSPVEVVPIPQTGTLPPDSPTPEPTFMVIPASMFEREAEPPMADIPAHAETFATVYVPRWGSDYIRPVSEGVGRRDVLNVKGIGHYPDTALPGGWGNFAIAGHRTTFGKPFERIDELQVGDALVIRTPEAWFVSRVMSSAIVSPHFGAALAPVPGKKFSAPDGRYITLTTCHPKFSASKRYVVYGVLDYWAPVGYGYPPEVIPDGALTVESVDPSTAEGPV